MKTLYETTATAIGGRSGSVSTEDQKLDLDLSVPTSMGGDGGEGVNPEQLFGAGYAACFGSGLQAVAKKEGITLDEDFSVSATIGFGVTEEGDYQLEATLDCYLPNIDIETGEDLVNKAHEICPFSRATRDNITVTLNLLLDD